MLATFIYGAGDIRVTDAPDPKIIKPTDALVQVTRACVCGSDLHPYHSAPDTAGRQEHRARTDRRRHRNRDPRSRNLWPEGDFVIAPFAISCGVCEFCRAGLQTACVNGGFWNDDAPGHQPGARPKPPGCRLADGTLVKVPGVDPTTADEALLASLLTLSDVYGTGWHAAHRAGVVAGRHGCGHRRRRGRPAGGAVRPAARRRAHRPDGTTRDRAPNLGREFGATDVVAERGQEGIDMPSWN